jgi:hypothetical protein
MALAGPVDAGVTGPAFYVDGVTYRTVGTPTDLGATDAPAQSWDTIYTFDGAQPSVATAAPGDRDYNGGRWMVHLLTFPSGYATALLTGDLNGNGVIDSADELGVALDTGDAIDAGIVRQFVCPVIPLAPPRG